MRFSLLLFVNFLAISIGYANPADLFVPPPQISNADKLSKSMTPNDISAKEKQVGVNTLALLTIPESLNIDLFGEVVTAIFDQTEKVSKDSYSWVGHIENSSNQVILIISGSLVQGNITYQNKQYHLRYTGSLNDQMLHILRLIDPIKLRDEHPPGFLEKKIPMIPFIDSKLGIKTTRKKIVSEDAATDSGEFIDVMVLWTDAAEQGANGIVAIQALIDLAFVETNQSYANSGILLKLRLVHKQKISYLESGSIFTDIGRLSSKTDGHIDNIHTLRDTHKADLVSLFTANQGLYCGLANVPLESFGDQAAFSVIDYNCAVESHSLAHEIGHNFSARHDWRAAPDTDLPYIYPYSHGHLHDGSDSWRTIMSYNKCTGSGPCVRLNYWSNPDKLYNGAPMGVPEGSTQATDNRKTLNNAAYFVANYRVSGIDTTAQFTSWDIDGNGQAGALTDGLLTLRFLFGFAGNTLTSNAIGQGATRTSAVDIQNYLQKGISSDVLDIDESGDIQALTDGLLVLRYLFGFREESLINNAVGNNATRSSANAISAYIQSKMP